MNIHTHTQGTTYEVGNPGPGLGQAQTCGRVTPVYFYTTTRNVLCYEMSPATLVQVEISSSLESRWEWVYGCCLTPTGDVRFVLD